MYRLYSYSGEDSYVFVSYAHKDKEMVYPIISRMQKDGYRVWFDEGIDPGTEWDETIAESIIKCGYFLAFVTDNYLASRNCRDELKYACDLPRRTVLVYLEEVNLTPGMALRMNRIQSIFKYYYSLENEFYKKLYTTDGFEEFVENSSDASANTNLEKRTQVLNEASRQTKTITLSDGSIYTGEVDSLGRPSGQGVIHYANGDVYDGEFWSGMRHGKGIYRYANGDIYEGEYRSNEHNGKGIYRYAEGDIYEGDHQNNTRVGKGIYRFSNGDVYEGEYYNNRYNGRGVYRFKDGDVYEGEFLDSKRHGKGVYLFADGSKLEGTFKDGDFIG